MTALQAPAPSELTEAVDNLNTHKIIALWAKITGQAQFKTESGSFGDRSNYAIGRLNFTDKNLEILVQQNPNNGPRTISVSRLSNGIPIAVCIIPADTNEDTTIKMNGKISDPSEFYDGVVVLLDDKQIGAEEVARLMKKKAEMILPRLV